jgi:adenylate cyclase
MAVGALTAAVFFALPWQWLAHWEDDTVDFRLRLRGVRREEPAVVVIGVDDSSFTVAERAPELASRDPMLAAMGRPWPWDRRVFAAVVRKLAASDARAVVFDFVFSLENPGDREFAAELARVKVPVILARQLTDTATPEGERSVGAVEPQPSLAGAGPHIHSGFANIWPDDDGAVRTVRLEVTRGELLGDPLPAKGEVGELSLAAATAAALGVPVGRAPGVVNYRGPAGAFACIPVENLFLPDRWDGPELDQGRRFRGKVVLVGPWSELRFKDIHVTPYGRMAGAELQANLIEAALGAGMLRPASAAAAGLAVLLAAGLAAGLCLTRSEARRQLAGLALALVAWLGLAQAALHWAGVLIPVAAPLGALLATGAMGISLHYAGEQRERRRLRSLLSSYVSEKVADIIVRQPESLEASLQGERRPVTVLFSDLRGFTRLTEERPPGELVAQLNEYLRAMVDCVLAEDGTVQKYIGDAILAVWGDTHSHGEAADAGKAVAAALAMEAALVQLNHSWAGRPDRVQLRMGIGLHQGIVTVGNLGHPRRREFGVLGDAVNTASRLEAATKPLGISLLAGGSVAQLAGGRFRFLPVGRVLVPGRIAPVEMHTPLGAAAAAPPEWVPGYAEGCARLAAGDFAAADRCFRALAPADSRLQGLVQFQARQAARLAAAPPSDWDGVIRIQEK